MTTQNNSGDDSWIKRNWLKLILIIFGILFALWVLNIVFNMVSNNPFTKAFSKIFGAGAAWMALATDNCKKATKCSEMKDDKEKCSSFSDCTCQSPSGDSCGNCKNTSGNKEGSGGTFSKRCMFGMLEFLGIAAAIFGIMSLGLGYLGNKAIKEAGTSDLTRSLSKANGQTTKDWSIEMKEWVLDELWRKKIDPNDSKNDVEIELTNLDGAANSAKKATEWESAEAKNNQMEEMRKSYIDLINGFVKDDKITKEEGEAKIEDYKDKYPIEK